MHSWSEFDWNRLMYWTISCHEIRSSQSSEIISPFSRFGWRTLHISCIEGNGKWKALKVLWRIKNGKHIRMKDFKYQEASKILFIPESDSVINIDGEVYQNDTIYISIIPACINFIGKTAPFDDAIQEYIQSNVRMNKSHELCYKDHL